MRIYYILVLFIMLLQRTSSYQYKYTANNVVERLNLEIYGDNKHKDNNKRILLLPSYVLGLANRFRTISSFALIAKQLNRKLVVLWQKSSECNANSDDLFSVKNTTDMIFISSDLQENIDIKTFEHRVVTFIQELYNWRQQIEESADSIPLTATFRRPSSFLIPYEEWNSVNSTILLVWSVTSHALDIYNDSSLLKVEVANCGTFNQLRSDVFYSQLIASTAVQRYLDLYSDIIRRTDRTTTDTHISGVSNDQGMVIGMHIRAFDTRHDWSVVPPVVHSNVYQQMSSGAADENHNEGSFGALVTPPHALRFDETSPLDAYITTIKQLLLVGDVDRSTTSYNNNNLSKLRVVVVSNSNQAKKLLTDMFGRYHIITLLEEDIPQQPQSCGGSYSRSGVCGMQLAMADFMMLQMSPHHHHPHDDNESSSSMNESLVFHSRGSSFASEAAVMHDWDVVEVMQDSSGNQVTAAAGGVIHLLWEKDRHHPISTTTSTSSSSASDVSCTTHAGCSHSEYLREQYKALCTGVRVSHMQTFCTMFKGCYMEWSENEVMDGESRAGREMCTVLLPFTHWHNKSNRSTNNIRELSMQTYSTQREVIYDRLKETLYTLDHELYTSYVKSPVYTSNDSTHGTHDSIGHNAQHNYDPKMLWVFAESSGQSLP